MHFYKLDIIGNKQGFAKQNYPDEDVAELDENALELDYWDGSQWKDAANACTPPSSYIRNTTKNQLILPVCRLGNFALFEGAALPYKIYLPLVLKETGG